MDRVLIGMLVVIGLSACGGGSSGGDAEVAISADIHYEETVTVANAIDPDEQHITYIYHSVADCMGYEASELPVIYVVEDLADMWPEVPYGVLGFTRNVGNFTHIFVLDEGLNDRTLSHEFVHYLMYRNHDTSMYNKNHLSEYFDNCRQ